MILAVYEAAAWVVVVKQDNKTRRRQPESIGRQWSCRRICIGGGGGGGCDSNKLLIRTALSFKRLPRLLYQLIIKRYYIFIAYINIQLLSNDNVS